MGAGLGLEVPGALLLSCVASRGQARPTGNALLPLPRVTRGIQGTRDPGAKQAGVTGHPGCQSRGCLASLDSWVRC